MHARIAHVLTRARALARFTRSSWEVLRYASRSRENARTTIVVVAMVLLGFRPVGGSVRRA